MVATCVGGALNTSRAGITREQARLKPRLDVLEATFAQTPHLNLLEPVCVPFVLQPLY